MASQTLVSTKKDVVDLGIGQIEFAGGFAADQGKPDAALFFDHLTHLFLHTFEDDLFDAASLTGRHCLELPVEGIRDVDCCPHKGIVPYLWQTVNSLILFLRQRSL